VGGRGGETNSTCMERKVNQYLEVVGVWPVAWEKTGTARRCLPRNSLHN
jgi:hypothetical protein